MGLEKGWPEMATDRRQQVWHGRIVRMERSEGAAIDDLFCRRATSLRSKTYQGDSWGIESSIMTHGKEIGESWERSGAIG
jgi:hypothetical protein